MNDIINFKPILLGNEHITIIGIISFIFIFSGTAFMLLSLLINIGQLTKDNLNKNIFINIGLFLTCIGGILLGIDIFLTKEFTFKTGQKIFGIGAILIGCVIELLSLAGLIYFCFKDDTFKSVFFHNQLGNKPPLKEKNGSSQE